MTDEQPRGGEGQRLSETTSQERSSRPFPGEEELLAGLKTREERAFGKLVELFSGKIIRKARFILGSVELAEEAAQDIFLKAHREMHSIRGYRVAPWLYAIAHNHCLDLLRKRNRNPQTVQFSERVGGNPKPEPIPEDLGRILGSLTPTERSVLLLRVVEHLDYNEISTITGLAGGTLRNMISKCLRRLREEMEANGL